MSTLTQISNWTIGQTVTASEMDNFSQDIYNRIGFITENNVNASGLILNIGTITQGSGSVSVGAGSFRFPDVTYSYLPYANTPIIGNADSAIVTVSGNGVIVARYSISPTSSGQPNYTIATSYLFVTSANPTTDCVICVITSGLITAYGNYFINQGANSSQVSSAIATNVALTPSNIPQLGLNIFPDVTDIAGSVTLQAQPANAGASQQMRTKDGSGKISQFQTLVSSGGAQTVSSVTNSDGVTVNNGIVVQFGVVPQLLGTLSGLTQTNPNSLVFLSNLSAYASLSYLAANYYTQSAINSTFATQSYVNGTFATQANLNATNTNLANNYYTAAYVNGNFLRIGSIPFVPNVYSAVVGNTIAIITTRSDGHKNVTISGLVISGGSLLYSSYGLGNLFSGNYGVAASVSAPNSTSSCQAGTNGLFVNCSTTGANVGFSISFVAS